MADYLKRLMFPCFFTPDEIDFLFNLSKEYPNFPGLLEALDQMKEKLNIKEADIGRMVSLITQRSL